MSIFKSLSFDQKEAVGLLQIGTFLEYFDLMLYVHMAVLLNELFFPKTDPHTAALLTAFAFCSTYVLRPFGALIFGYIGDHIGRKTTVIFTTMMMAISCIIIASLPTYAQIGITAAWLVTACRVIQGLSSMGEVMCAEIYVTEITTPPIQYPAVACIPIASQIGATFALGVASLVTHFSFNWRIAFWIGAGIAVIGSVARTRLRETPVFLKKIQQIRKKYVAENRDKKSKISNVIWTQKFINKEKMDQESFWAYIVAAFGWPLSFYLVFMYFTGPLKVNYGYTPEDVIFHNFLLSIISLIMFILVGVLSYTINPMKILKAKGIVNFAVILFLPFLLMYAKTPIHIFLLQTLLIASALSIMPASPIFFKYIPTLKRLTTASFVYALSRAIIYVITSFSLVYLTEKFGYYGLWLVSLPVNIGFLWSVNYFAKLEKTENNKFSSALAA